MWLSSSLSPKNGLSSKWSLWKQSLCVTENSRSFSRGIVGIEVRTLTIFFPSSFNMETRASSLLSNVLMAEFRGLNFKLLNLDPNVWKTG